MDQTARKSLQQICVHCGQKYHAMMGFRLNRICLNLQRAVRLARIAEDSQRLDYATNQREKSIFETVEKISKITYEILSKNIQPH